MLKVRILGATCIKRCHLHVDTSFEHPVAVVASKSGAGCLATVFFRQVSHGIGILCILQHTRIEMNHDLFQTQESQCMSNLALQDWNHSLSFPYCQCDCSRMIYMLL